MTGVLSISFTLSSLMEQCNCVVCASRDDPMPTFVTEGLIFGKPCIVSEHTGTAGRVTEGVDGFLSKDDDPQQLAEKRAWAIEHPEALAAMHGSCRRLYEQQFSNESYVATPTRFYPAQGVDEHAFIEACLLSSVSDDIVGMIAITAIQAAK